MLVILYFNSVNNKNNLSKNHHLLFHFLILLITATILLHFFVFLSKMICKRTKNIFYLFLKVQIAIKFNL